MNLTRLLMRWLLGRRLPTVQGTVGVAGISDNVQIHRDRWGIPHIEANSERDVCFAIGFCHGQDRTFQLELLLRAVRGTLSELVGASGLPVDRLSRRIGFRRAAEAQWPLIDAELRADIEAYAEGVAAGATKGLPRRPHEFVLLRGRPTPWHPLDSLGVVKLISFTLASNWDIELARFKILLADGPDALAALDPVRIPGVSSTLVPGKERAGAKDDAPNPMLDRLSEELKAFASLFHVGGGSNNWTVSPARTTTGRPLLANDPHLDARLPPHWYLVHARTPSSRMAGATFLGGPAVQSGHNGFAAWGITAGLIDNTDLFREQIGPDGCSVRQGDQFVPCEVREEVIRVKNEASVVERVLVTPRGPIIGPALRNVDEALSLRAVWLEPRPLDGLLRLHRVRSFAEFHRAAEHWPAAAQNMVYADETGTIGWQMFGLAPRRRKGWGLLPAPGWDADYGWEADLVPFEQLPHVENPAHGFHATANNRPVPDGEGPYLGCDWLDGYRVASIDRELRARTDWDVPSTQNLQMNQRAVAWDEMRTAVLSTPAAADADARQALELLRSWDGRVSVDSSAATVYELFIAEMARRLAQAKAPRSFAVVLGEALGPIVPYNFLCYRRTAHLVHLLHEQPTGWFPHSWPEEIAGALAAVVRRLRTEYGGDATQWAFGRLRKLTLHHPLSRKPWLAPLFNLGPFPCGGDCDTINQGAVLPLDPLAQADNIASMRMVVDVGAWSNSRFSLPGGQSGNPLSPHYDDLLSFWLRGDGVPIAWTEEEVRQATRHTLKLEPVLKAPLPLSTGGEGLG